MLCTRDVLNTLTLWTKLLNYSHPSPLKWKIRIWSHFFPSGPLPPGSHHDLYWKHYWEQRQHPGSAPRSPEGNSPAMSLLLLLMPAWGGGAGDAGRCGPVMAFKRRRCFGLKRPRSRRIINPRFIEFINAFARSSKHFAKFAKKLPFGPRVISPLQPLCACTLTSCTRTAFFSLQIHV